MGRVYLPAEVAYSDPPTVFLSVCLAFEMNYYSVIRLASIPGPKLSPASASKLAGSTSLCNTLRVF